MAATIRTHYLVLAIHPCQLNGNFLRSIRARIIYYNDLPCKLTGILSFSFSVLSSQYALFLKHLRQ